MRKSLPHAILLLLGGVLAVALAAQQAPPQAPTAWTFAVSGDSRNCGDVVMPAIAASALQNNVAFYWHLGDLRKIYDFDEDMQHQPERLVKPMSISDYLNSAWPDYIENQIAPFGSTPFFLGIGNHETAPPKKREEFLAQFADWLNQPALQRQRLRDNPKDHVLRTYYHWIDRGVDFVYLDNATLDQFDAAQMRWFDGVVARAAANPDVKSVVVGMHMALPDSIAADHSMNNSPAATETGRRVYQSLLRLQNEAHKNVYVLASHSHFFMDGIYNTEYSRTHGGVLPGWIIGTAGAVRYALPPNAKDARAAETNVYGYLLGKVSPSGEVELQFVKLDESQVPAAITSRYTADFVHWCFAQNTNVK